MGWPDDNEIFDSSDKDSLYMLAIEFRHAFNPAKNYLIGLYQDGALEGKTYGEIREMLTKLFGRSTKETLFRQALN